MGIAAKALPADLADGEESARDRLRGWFWLTIVVVELVWLSAIGYGLVVLLA